MASRQRNQVQKSTASDEKFKFQEDDDVERKGNKMKKEVDNEIGA